MDEPLPAQKRPIRVVRRLDHDAVDARLGASLIEYGQVSQEAGLTSEEAVRRLRSHLEDGPERRAEGTRFRWRMPTAYPMRRWLIGTAAVLAVALIGVGALAILGSGSSDEAPVPVAAGEVLVPPAAVAGFAELFVAVYLGQAGEGAEHHLEPFLGEPVDLLGLSPGRLYVQNLATVGIRSDAEGWVVDVAAQVLRRLDAGYGDPVIQHYRVALRDDGGLVARALPLLTPGF